MRAAITGWGTALPDQRLTNADLEAPRRHHRRSGSSSAPASASAASPARARPPRASPSRPAPPRSSRPGSPPTPSTSSIVATATPEQLIPHTGAFVGDGLGHALRLLRPQRRLRRASSTSWWSAPSLLTAGNLDHVLRRSAPRRSRASPTPPTAAPASSSATAPRRWCSAPRPERRPRPARLGPRLRRLRHRPARDPRRRQPPARHRTRPSPTATTTCKMAGPEVFRRAVRIVVESATAAPSSAPASTVDDVDVVRAPPGQRPDHRVGRRAGSGSRRSARS